MPQFPVQTKEPRQAVFISNAEWYTRMTGRAIDNTSRTWSTTNGNTLTPIFIPRSMTIKKLYAYNGAAVSGNCCISLYAPRYIAGRTSIGALNGFFWEGAMTRLMTSGAVAQAGISQWQIFDVTDRFVTPGFYVLVYGLNNTTGQMVMLSDTPPSSAVNYGALIASEGNGVPHGDPLYSVNPTTMRLPLLAVGGIA